MAQTTITAAPAAGIVGTFATSSAAPQHTRSAIAAETIPVGTFVVFTAGAETCELPDAATEVNGGRGLGIAMRPASGATSYATGEEVTIGYSGEIWVTPVTSVAAGASALVAITGTGAFDDTTGESLPNAVFTSSGTGPVKVWLSGPFK
jgi:hypothetical protein